MDVSQRNFLAGPLVICRRDRLGHAAFVDTLLEERLARPASCHNGCSFGFIGWLCAPRVYRFFRPGRCA
jgi:hypothetical protein